MSKSIVQIVARNVLLACGFHGIESGRALGRLAGVAANTAENIMHPEKRETGTNAATRDRSPNMVSLEKIARAMGYEAWQLMLENFDPADKPTRVLRKTEADFYGKVEALYRDLPPDPLNGKD